MMKSNHGSRARSLLVFFRTWNPKVLSGRFWLEPCGAGSESRRPIKRFSAPNMVPGYESIIVHRISWEFELNLQRVIDSRETKLRKMDETALMIRKQFPSSRILPHLPILDFTSALLCTRTTRLRESVNMEQAFDELAVFI